MKKYVMDYNPENNFHAGSKARRDVNLILVDKGYTPAYFAGNKKECRRFVEKCIIVMNHYINYYRTISGIEDNSFLLIQGNMPFMHTLISKAISQRAKKKKILTAILIHDVEKYRLYKNDNFVRRFFHDDLNILSCFDYVIAHNHTMTNMLVANERLNNSKVYTLELFDYLCKNKDVTRQIEMKRKIIIAGNLSYDKSKYIYKLRELYNNTYNFELYGKGYSKDTDSFVQYKGVFNPEDIPFNSGFGLVWDGDSIDTCDGITGEYTRINNPHKLSLYMAAGIPVIVWSQAAIADFVLKNKVGLSVNSLYEVKEIMEGMTQNEYDELRNNVVPIQEKVMSGFYLNRVVDEIVSDIEESK